jgi:hypothetical protein
MGQPCSAAEDGSCRLFGSESSRALQLKKIGVRLEKIRPNRVEDSQLPMADAPQASPAVCEVSLPPELCGRTAEPLRADAGCSDLLFYPRNLRQGSKLRKRRERSNQPLSFRLLWHNRLVWNILVVFVGAYEDQPQRGNREQQHHRTNQHASHDHSGERTLHLAANTG